MYILSSDLVILTFLNAHNILPFQSSLSMLTFVALNKS